MKNYPLNDQRNFVYVKKCIKEGSARNVSQNFIYGNKQAPVNSSLATKRLGDEGEEREEGKEGEEGGRGGRGGKRGKRGRGGRGGRGYRQ